MLSLLILRTFLIANINTLNEYYSYLTTYQLQMLITNISSLIFFKDFTLAFNCDVRKCYASTFVKSINDNYVIKEICRRLQAMQAIV
jgi:hypothetical protein